MPGRGRGKAGEGIELTEQGREEAEALLRQHRLAERFLVDVPRQSGLGEGARRSA